MPTLSDEEGPTSSIRRSWRFWASVVFILLVLLAARPSLGWWAHRTASTHLQAGRVHQAQMWLARAQRFAPNHVASQVLLARSYRHLDQHGSWQRAIAIAREIDADAAAVQHEERLGALRWESGTTVADDEWKRLVDAGVDRDEAAFGVVYGLLAAGETERAERLLLEWQPVAAQPQQVAFMRGLLAQVRQDWEHAKKHFEAVLEREPEHGMAHATLAQLSENLRDLESAEKHFAYWAQHQPDQEQPIAGWARVLRQLGRAKESQQVLQRFAASPDGSLPLILEWAHVEYELGNYDEAVQWFQRAGLENSQDGQTLLTAATALALAGEVLDSKALFRHAFSISDRERRLEVLRKRSANDPSDREAVEELRRLAQGASEPPQNRDEAFSHPISRLFSQHCASCHGKEGDGMGSGSKHLYPPARDLGKDPYRLVTSVNHFPLPADIEVVIRDGIPGTAMPAFSHLSAEQRRELVDQVYQLRLQGLRDQRRERFSQIGEPIDEVMIEQWLNQQAAAAQPLAIPDIQQPFSQLQIAEGQQLFTHAGCAQCHGDDGRGAFDVPLFHEDGSHAIPRDLVAEPMKGGATPEALFARIRLGMPGTPHPASPTLNDKQLLSLVAYCRSIAEPQQDVWTNQQRAERANRRAIKARVGAKNSSAGPVQPDGA